MVVSRISIARTVKTHIKVIAGILAGVVVGGTGAVVLADIPNSTTQVYHACYRNATGALRVIDKEAGEACTSIETEIFWNQVGPPGQNGQDGQDGEDGEDGAPGSGGAGTLVNNLVGAEFSDASLQYQNLSNLDFSNAKFNFTKFTGADASGANFSGATDLTNLDRANFQGANFTGAVFSQTLRATNANFEGANFTNATIYGLGGFANSPALLTGAIFHFANFTGTSFVPSSFGNRISGGDFSNAQFVNATMNGMVFEGSPIFTDATWDNTICPDGTNSNDNGNTCVGHGL